MLRAARLVLLFALAWGLTGCFRPSPATLPNNEVAYVAVLSGEMPGSFRDIARHSWIVASVPRSAPVAATPYERRSNDPRRPPPRRSPSLRRYEWVGNAHATSLASVDAAFSSDVDVGDVAVHGVKTGTPAEITEIVACLERETEKYKDFNCGCWPGPNSNTFVAHLGREIPVLRLALPSTAVGKDFVPLTQSVGPTPSHTGVQVSLYGVLGVLAGWEEGIELNILGLVMGIDFRHPALKLPGFGRVPG